MFLTHVGLTKNEIINIVKFLSNKKSSGYDDISMSFIKKIIYFIVNPLTDIINKSFRFGKFPSSCKIAKISPIFKSGNKSDHKNYRPNSASTIFLKNY